MENCVIVKDYCTSQIYSKRASTTHPGGNEGTNSSITAQQASLSLGKCSQFNNNKDRWGRNGLQWKMSKNMTGKKEFKNMPNSAPRKNHLNNLQDFSEIIL